MKTPMMELAIAAVVILAGLWALIELVAWISVSLRNRGIRRRARAEAELNRKQEELRATILNLASQLSADALEARKALIHESFIAAQIERQSPKR